MRYKLNKRVYLSIYIGFYIISFLSAILFRISDLFYALGYFNFGILLIVILISFAAFLSTLFSNDKFKETEYKTLLMIHSIAFLSFMTYYAILYI